MATLNTYFPVASSRIQRVLVIGALSLAGSLAFTGLVQTGSAQAATSCPNAAAPLTNSTTSVNNVRNAIICLTNEQRKARALPALVVNVKLTNAAQNYSLDMVRRKFFLPSTHSDPDGDTLDKRLTQAGYCPGCKFFGENIRWASGSPTAQQTVDAWMASTGHRNNILNANFREIGVGVAYGTPDKRYANGGTFTQDFGAR
jgi:uncharacterized protein YkwD